MMQVQPAAVDREDLHSAEDVLVVIKLQPLLSRLRSLYCHLTDQLPNWFIDIFATPLVYVGQA